MPRKTTPKPPSSKSFDSKGKLKPTKANRALSPSTAPDELFRAEALRKQAHYADDHTIILRGDVKSEQRGWCGTGSSLHSGGGRAPDHAG